MNNWIGDTDDAWEDDTKWSSGTSPANSGDDAVTIDLTAHGVPAAPAEGGTLTSLAVISNTPASVDLSLLTAGAVSTSGTLSAGSITLRLADITGTFTDAAPTALVLINDATGTINLTQVGSLIECSNVTGASITGVLHFSAGGTVWAVVSGGFIGTIQLTNSTELDLQDTFGGLDSSIQLNIAAGSKLKNIFINLGGPWGSPDGYAELPHGVSEVYGASFVTFGGFSPDKLQVLTGLGNELVDVDFAAFDPESPNAGHFNWRILFDELYNGQDTLLRLIDTVTNTRVEIDEFPTIYAATLTQATALLGTTISGTYVSFTPDKADLSDDGGANIPVTAADGVWSMVVPTDAPAPFHYSVRLIQTDTEQATIAGFFDAIAPTATLVQAGQSVARGTRVTGTYTNFTPTTGGILGEPDIIPFSGFTAAAGAWSATIPFDALLGSGSVALADGVFTVVAGTITILAEAAKARKAMSQALRQTLGLS